MKEPPIPREIGNRIYRDNVLFILQEQELLFDGPHASIQSYGTNLEKTLNAAFDAELQALDNKRRVNKWFEENMDHLYYPVPILVPDRGYFTFIYQQPTHKNYFFNDFPVQTEVVQWMLDNNKLEYYGEIQHQQTPHRAWTTPRNAKLLRLNSN